MTSPFPIYTLDQIKPLLDRKAIIEAVRDALIKHSAGAVQSPMPGQLIFEEVRGDCHIKYGHMAGGNSFAIKIATGFYGNAKRGLPVNNGLTMVFDAQTGAPQCLFQDQGWMTAWRTAAATALAAHCMAPRMDARIGIVGTGLQAQLSVTWIAEMLPDATFRLCGRDAGRTAQIASICGAESTSSVEDLFTESDIVITATPSATALFNAELARPGMHFVGLGADGPEKQEIPESLFTRAAHIITDDHRQCLALSDFGRAVRAGKIDVHADIALGKILSGETVVKRRPDEISVIDLTGLAAQDIAISSWFLARLAGAGTSRASTKGGVSRMRTRL